jgi:hypothetical protein
MIRDNIMLYDNLDQLYPSCRSCSRNDHFIEMCPRIQYIPDRELILKRYVITQTQNRNRFKRSKRNRLNSLRFKNEILESIKPFMEDPSMQAQNNRHLEDDDNDKNDNNDSRIIILTPSSAGDEGGIHKNPLSKLELKPESKGLNFGVNDILLKKENDINQAQFIEPTGRNLKKKTFLGTLIQPLEKPSFIKADRHSGRTISVSPMEESKLLKNFDISEEKNQKEQVEPSTNGDEHAHRNKIRNENKIKEMGDLFNFNFDNMKNFSNYFKYNNAESITRGIKQLGLTEYYKKERNRRYWISNCRKYSLDTNTLQDGKKNTKKKTLVAKNRTLIMKKKL